MSDIEEHMRANPAAFKLVGYQTFAEMDGKRTKLDKPFQIREAANHFAQLVRKEHPDWLVSVETVIQARK